MQRETWTGFFEGTSAPMAQEADRASLGRVPISMLFCAVGVVMTTVLGVAVCSEFIGVPPETAQLLIRLFVAVLLVAWIALSLSIGYTDPWRFVKVFCVTLGMCASIAGMTLTMHTGDPRSFFWLSLAIWLFVAAAGVRRYAREGLEGVLLVALAVWTVSGAVIALGESHFCPFARDAVRDIHGLHVFLDVRHLSGAVAIVSAGTLAVVRAFRKPLSTPPSFRPLHLVLPVQGPAWQALLEPFVVILNAFLAVVHEVVDVLYRAAVIIGNTFLRIGAELARVIRTMRQNLLEVLL